MPEKPLKQTELPASVADAPGGGPSNQAITTTARMLEMQSVARRLFGVRYAEVIDPWKRVLVHVAQDRGIGLISACLWITKDSDSRGHVLEDVDILAMTAAMVDLSGIWRAQ